LSHVYPVKMIQGLFYVYRVSQKISRSPTQPDHINMIV